jgi:NAD(P)-dependent dehydrogenase (short-subunit alcohol dehydrogenase family)
MLVALITGTGIGLATALHLGRQGHDVWAGVRNPTAATDLRAAIDTSACSA